MNISTVISLPPSPVRGRLPGPVVKLGDELAQLYTARDDAIEAAEETKRALIAAEEDDLLAAAAAVRAGKAAPTRKGEKAKAAAEQAQANLAAVREAIKGAGADFAEAVAEQAPAAIATLTKAVEEADAEILKATRRVEQLIADRGSVTGLKAWIEDGGERPFSANRSPMSKMQGQHGDKLYAQALAAELAATFTPAPPPPTNPQQSALRPAVTGGR